MNKSDFLHALANLVSLGITSPRDAYPMLKRWRRLKREMNAYVEFGADAGLKYVSDLALLEETEPTIYVSFHFGTYIACVSALAQRFPGRKCYWLISTESRSQEHILLPIAQKAGIDLEFLSGSTTMIRGLRRALSEGAFIFVLIDLPWGINQIRDRTFPVRGGTLQAKSQLFKLARHLNVRPRLIVAEYDETRDITRVVDKGFCTQEEAFAQLAIYLEKQPYLWERLDQCHRMAEFEPTGGYIAFMAKGEHFLFAVDSKKIFRLPATLRRQVRILKTALAEGEQDHAATISQQIRLATHHDMRTVL